MKTLEQYLRETYGKGIIDHQIRVSVDDKNRVTFYIHAQGHDSDTLDFEVKDNSLDTDSKIFHLSK